MKGSYLYMTLGVETFRWNNSFFDITQLIYDIQHSLTDIALIDLDKEFIETYYNAYLNPSAHHPKPPLAINYDHANSLNTNDLSTPIILLYVGINNGLVSFNEKTPEPYYVVADGNHRIIAALRLDLTLKAYKLSKSDSNKYLIKNTTNLI